MSSICSYTCLKDLKLVNHYFLFHAKFWTLMKIWLFNHIFYPTSQNPFQMSSKFYEKWFFSHNRAYKTTFDDLLQLYWLTLMKNYGHRVRNQPNYESECLQYLFMVAWIWGFLCMFSRMNQKMTNCKPNFVNFGNSLFWN